MTGLQIKRLQKLIGDPLLTKTASSVALTEIGKLVLDLARRKLSANDALRSLSGVAAQGEPVQVGMNSMLLDFFVNRRDHALSENLAVTSATCSVIMKAFNERQLDVAMVMDIKDHRSALGQNLIAEFEVDFAWIGTSEFAVGAGRPIPLAVWPADHFLFLDALSKTEFAYRPIFSSPDYFAKLAAVKSGTCLAVIPRRAIAPPFIEVDEPYLPKLPSQKALLGVRGDPSSDRFRPIVSALSSLELASAR